MDSKSFLWLSNHRITIALLLLSFAFDDHHRVEAYHPDKPSIFNDADQYSDTHAAVKFDPDAKKLYFFAGPHKSASTSVEKFFSKWANKGFESNHPHSRALQYWRWPTFDSSGDAKQYGKLVKKKDDKVYLSKALNVIQASFLESDNGVFLGTEEFDQVGPDKWLDAMPVMEAIVDKLGVDHKDIKVVLNYRTPRVDQWISIWKHAGEEYAGASYEDFMCKAHANDDDKKYRFSMIGAEMNPLNAAKVFLERGWQVTLLDMGGVEKEGKHIVHTIGCEVLMGGCENGILGSLQDYLPQKNAVEKDFNELNEEETAKIEKLFQSRDCAYQSQLQKYIDKGQMEVLHQDSLWDECTSDDDYYKKFKDNTGMMYNALLGQLECTSDPHQLTVGADMDAALTVAGASKIGIGIGSGFNVLFFIVVLIAAIGYAAFQVLQQNSKKRQQILEQGGDIDDIDAKPTSTEMTSYPLEESNNDVGGFQDDVDLDDEDISDQNHNPIV